MKKIFLGFLCAPIFFMSFELFSYAQEDALSYEREYENGSELSISAGWKYLERRMTFYEIQDDIIGERGNDKGHLFGFSALYRHQVPERIYGKLKGSFYWGNLYNNELLKEYKNKKTKFKERHINGALGYTFAFCDDRTLVSPFVSLYYIHDAHSFDGIFNDEDHHGFGEDIIFNRKTVYYGLIAMIGVDIKHIFKENFEVGAVISIGLPINANERYSGEVVENKEELDDPMPFNKRMGLKQTFCYEILVPLHYCRNNWKVGVELSHSHTNWKSSLHKAVINTFGAAVDAVWVF